jgi:type II secretory pathway pseudopilin PulG
LLVVISIVSLLMAIVVPAVGLVKRQARAVVGMTNQREIAAGLNLFALDNRDRYPDSVATIGFNEDWKWSNPTRMIGYTGRSPQVHRAMSAYLASYIPDAGIMFCPNAPRRYKYLQECWDAGDDWDNPDTELRLDPFTGTYCFYWNYTGYLANTDTLFKGPSGPASGRRRSRLLVTDYFGYDHYRSPGAFGSCEKMSGAGIAPETQLQSSFWTSAGDPNMAMPEFKLRAAYTDGHVETYSASNVVPMKVSLTSKGRPPDPDGEGGIFFIPRAAVE